MKRSKIGENMYREWGEDSCRQELWDAIKLIEHDAPAGAQELENLSKRGSALSMMWLGHALFVGRYGLEKDAVAGEKWLRKSAECGSIEGLYALARLLRDSGRDAEAMGLFKQAAELGYSPAMFCAGWGYYFGLGADRDIDSAYEYFKKAADAGHLYGTVWESYTFRKRKKNAITWIRNLLIRVPLVFRVTYALITYPSSDRLRK